jgi:hypothetical protein
MLQMMLVWAIFAKVALTSCEHHIISRVLHYHVVSFEATISCQVLSETPFVSKVLH